MPGGSDDVYPTLPQHGARVLLLLLTVDLGWEQALVGTRGLVGTRMQRGGTHPWEGWGCCHTCSCSWVAHLPSGPVLREAS